MKYLVLSLFLTGCITMGEPPEHKEEVKVITPSPPLATGPITVTWERDALDENPATSFNLYWAPEGVTRYEKIDLGYPLRLDLCNDCFLKKINNGRFIYGKNYCFQMSGQRTNSEGVVLESELTDLLCITFKRNLVFPIPPIHN